MAKKKKEPEEQNDQCIECELKQKLHDICQEYYENKGLSLTHLSGIIGVVHSEITDYAKYEHDTSEEEHLPNIEDINLN